MLKDSCKLMSIFLTKSPLNLHFNRCAGLLNPIIMIEISENCIK